MANRHPNPPAFLRYSFAVLATGIALGLALLLRRFEVRESLFLLAVGVTVWYGGVRPGILAILLSIAGMDYYFIPPVHQFEFSFIHVPYFIVFTCVAVVVSWVSVLRRNAEQSLHKARNELESQVAERTAALYQQASLLDLTHDSMFVRDLGKNVITYWNRGSEELYGWSAGQALGKVSHELLKTIFPVPLEQIVADLVSTGRWEGELIHSKADGNRVVVASRWSLQRDDQSRPIAILEINNDITARKRAEEALRDSEEQWKAVFENNPTMYFMVDTAGTVLSVNLFGAEQLGYRVDDLVGDSVLKVFQEADREAARRQVAMCVEQLGQTMTWELRKVRKNGGMLWVRETARAMLIKDRPVVLVVCEDITERKRTEEELTQAQAGLAQSERRYRYIFETTRVSIWEEDFGEVNAAIDELRASGVQDFRQYLAEHPEFVEEAIAKVKIVDVNQATLDLFGARDKHELLVSLNRVFTPDTREVFAGELVALAEGQSWFESQTTLKTLGGKRIAVLFTIAFPGQSAKLDSVLVSIIDITHQKRAEEERERLHQLEADLAHMNRVTTMGELTASLAHEVNQPIAAIVTNANTCVRWLTRDKPDVEEALEAAKWIIKDATRAGEIVSRIRLLFKKGTPHRDFVDINEVIREMTLLLRSETMRRGVEVHTRLANLPRVVGDRVQVQQVLMNLMMNGIEAMKGVDGDRELTIESKTAENKEVIISVSDTGMGLPPQHADRIFNAFYSTKPKGTGMGLTISRSIVEAHGGRLWADPNSSRGATFYVSLPIDAQEA
jgi:PAS domain S-box-containing protein